MKYFVTIAEFSTGIVLAPDGSRFLGDGEPTLGFESEIEARAFAARHFAENPNHECVVSDQSGVEIATFRPRLTGGSTGAACSPWWKFW